MADGALVSFHRWKRPRRVALDITGQALIWPTYVLGWVSVEMIPASIWTRLRLVLDELRRGRQC